MSVFGKRGDEKVVKRKSYYSFAKRYPGSESESGYLIGDSLKIKRRENKRRIVFILVLVLLFVCSFVAVSTAMFVSEKSPGDTEAVTQQSAQGETQAQAEATTIIISEAAQ